MFVWQVPIQQTPTVWPVCEVLLVRAFDNSEDCDINEAKFLVTQGAWHLFIARDSKYIVHGAATVNFFNRMNDRVAFVTAISGRLITKKPIKKQFYALLRENGSTIIECAARGAQKRLWQRAGMKEKCTIMTQQLTWNL